MNKYRILQVLLFLLFCISAGLLLHHMVLVPERNQKKIEALKKEFPEEPSGGSSLQEDPLPSGVEGGIGALNLLALQSRYPDIKAWLTIPGTGIDYPVLQSTKEDSEYYLEHNYLKEYDANGSLFFQYNCDLKESENLVIYGHNMNSGAMFGNLDHYMDAAYCKEHKQILLQMVEGTQEYEVLSVTKTDASMLPFLQVDFPGHDGLFSYVDQAKRLALFDTETSYDYYEQVVTLVTCSYEWEDARTVIVAAKKQVT